MVANPLTNSPAKVYQPNMVLNQRESIDMRKSHAEVEEVTANKTIKIADSVKFFR